MYIVHVFVHVKEESIEAFKEVSVENARQSMTEPGIARFDVIQQQDEPDRFVLVEVYHAFEHSVRHKETDHYMRWRDAVAYMMEEPRYSIKFYNVHPNDEGWD